MLTFPVNQGKTLNIVAFHTTADDWTEYPRLTRSGTRDEALRDFNGFGPNVVNLLQLTDEKLNIVCTTQPAYNSLAIPMLTYNAVGHLRPRPPPRPNLPSQPPGHLRRRGPRHIPPSRRRRRLLHRGQRRPRHAAG